MNQKEEENGEVVINMTINVNVIIIDCSMKQPQCLYNYKDLTKI